MSNRDRIGANNATIQECINKANTLPDASGGGSGGELVAAFSQASFHYMNGFATVPYNEGSQVFTMAGKEGPGISSFYGTVQPGDKYRVEVTRIEGYDYWQTFLFSVGDWGTLIEPATNANVLKHVTVRDDNTYEVTIPEGCLWFNVNFNNQGTCVIYKLN